MRWREWMRGTSSLLLASIVLSACATTQPPTLYQRLEVKDGTGTLRGGRDAIRLIVDDFVANLAADSRTKERFGALKPPEVERLRSLLADQLCEASGGPCSYYGRDMKTTDRKSTRLNSSHIQKSRMPSSA